ncbi:2-keto-4-pentenoate hydratase [Roseiflexus castenholzii]|jgi:2-keto-4-pentenoate hydratase|uniref:4-oxalocrotonate decarboxylase n=1 Tax=Roseiflexus castenholzii (strain DSM 13941 / HLO8) TaxID=383372 RepID=A7NLT7_ROSCS|nr:fumarylacetoacetate hydrolase family protein [Roseiflexus castenholzii]ABU58485.1 4-oxalocrotonate decarboxylase [Roseiflexus castenholzii DSM 13941]
MPEQPVGGEDIDAIARRLDNAWEQRQPLAPLSASMALTPEHAYAIQSRWTDLRLARGERVIGRKIGLTSRAIQQQLGVNEPDYGSLWASRYFPLAGGRVDVPADLFVQARVEGELAFLIGRPLREPGVTLHDVLAATDAIAAAIEIVDSRIADWRITLVDTVADNASYGGFTLGPWSRALRSVDLRTVGMLLHHNGEPAVQGIGAAALGHPARAVAWLANKLIAFGINLEPGDIVLSGSLGPAIPMRTGDLFTLEIHGQPPLSMRFV